MRSPPSVKRLLPSLQMNEDLGLAALSAADIKKHLPSLTIENDGLDLTEQLTIKMSLADLRKFLRIVLTGVVVDEKWYASQVPGLSQALKDGLFPSATEHYFIHGYLEGRLPTRPTVDEDYYLKTYSDIAEAVKTKKLKSGYEHYVRMGYAEGRNPKTPRPRGRRPEYCRTLGGFCVRMLHSGLIFVVCLGGNIRRGVWWAGAALILWLTAFFFRQWAERSNAGVTLTIAGLFLLCAPGMVSILCSIYFVARSYLGRFDDIGRKIR